MNRHAFIYNNARGRILNIGSGPRKDDVPARSVHLDIDFQWRPTVQGDAYKLPFRDETFNSVVMTDLHEHLERPSAATREAWRVLKPGGKLVTVIWKFPDEEEEPDKPNPGSMIHGHINKFTQEEILPMISRCRPRPIIESWTLDIHSWSILLRKPK